MSRAERSAVSEVTRQTAVRRRHVGGAVRDFAVWLANYGADSQDQYDLWATGLGRVAKSIYYRSSIVGAPLVAPFVLLDTFLPGSRSLVRSRTRFPIADAHYTMGLFALAKVDADATWARQAQSFLDSLRQSRCPGFQHHCWGYPYDWVTCSGTFPTGTPLITTTPYVYEAFEAGFEVTGKREYLEIMESTATFAFEDIVDTEVSPGEFACSYSPIDRRRVVNASAYRAFLLSRGAQRFGRQDWMAAANGNIEFVLGSQRPDGSWLYAMDGNDQFVDNFHTCFVLKNLVKTWQTTGGDVLREAVKRGYDYYKQNLLDSEGQPIAFAQTQRATLRARELYDYAEGINLALLMRQFDSDAEGIACRLVDEVLNDWVLPDGHFVTRKTPLGRNKVPYHRWAQSQTFRALAVYCATQN